MVQYFIHPPVLGDFLNTIANMYQPQKWNQLIENPTHTITQHSHQHASRPDRPKIKCTETGSIYQQQNVSYILSYFYVNYYPCHEPPPLPTTYLTFLTQDNDTLKLAYHLSPSHPISLYFQMEIPTRSLFFNLPQKKILFHYSLNMDKR